MTPRGSGSTSTDPLRPAPEIHLGCVIELKIYMKYIYIYMVLPLGPLESTCAPVACASLDLAMGELQKLATIARSEHGLSAVIEPVEGGNVVVVMHTMRGDDQATLATGALIMKVPYVE